MTTGNTLRALVASSLIAGLVGPLAWAGDDPVDALQARYEIPEAELLDVGIHVFDEGIPEDEYERYELEQKGIFADLRKSEARYIPVQLKRTLESTGYWGAVRLVPRSNVVDVVVSGRIRKSTGKDLDVEIVVVDARGKGWFQERYEEEANFLVYANSDDRRDPFQNLYNRIANDLVEAREKLDEEDFEDIRRVSQLKFAQDMAPAAFEDYLTVRKGRYEPARLPSEDDPMMERVVNIRERDYMFIDTLNEYYANLFVKMEEPYDSWRAYSYEEQVAYEKLQRTAKWEKILGIAGAVAGGVIAAKSGSRAGHEAGEAAIMGGLIAVADGQRRSEEAKMHLEALRELAQSFDTEVAPILIDVEGEVLRLTGSVDTQYDKWRQLLRQIFAAETGLPLDPNAESVPATKGNSRP